MEIITRKLDEIIPYKNNPRKNDGAVDAVAESIRQCGYCAPIIVDENGVILAGHTRLKAIKKLGWSEVEVCVKSGLTEKQKKKFRILDNKTTEFAEWDFDALQVELDGMDFQGFKFGFEIETPAVLEDDFDVDAVAESIVEPVTKPGDIWTLGRHRLMCGDSTDRETVDRLMDGQKADLVLTDPPYNVDYEGATGLKIQNDNFGTDEECGEKLWKPAFTNMRDNSKDCCAVYCFMPQGGTHMMMMMMMMRDAGWQVKHEIIWKKQSLVLGRQDYNYQHEPIMYGWNKTHKFYGAGKYHTTSIWEYDRPTKSKEHPTMKPIELLSEILLNSSLKDDALLDLFGGSGSTLIACEQLNRTCYMMELDCKYSDVIVNRYINLKGNASDVYLERDGTRKPYSEVC